MRRLILSDIHANMTALQAALGACQGKWDQALCLGDVVGYGPDPNEVVEQIQPLLIAAIRGNHDKAVAGVSDADDFNPIARAAVQWTRASLRPGNLSYVAGLPPGPMHTDEISLFHGSLRDEDEYIFVSEQALDGLLVAPNSLSFFGHTHIQGGFSFAEAGLQTLMLQSRRAGIVMMPLRLERGTRYLLNPGSIGQPRDGDPRAAFAIFDAQQSLVEFWRVPYDIAQVAERLGRAGLPESLASRLFAGR
jgi:predicted phosphodiesterase